MNHRVLILALFFACLITSSSFSASFVVAELADFTAANASFENLVASDSNGSGVNYLRIYNRNPGADDGTPALRFGGLGIWGRKREISLAIPMDKNTAGADIGLANRINEKVQIDLSVIGNAKADWSDLRLTDWQGNQVDFRLLGYETPVDNLETPVRLLFEANANAGASAAANTYHLYYGNPDATSVATSSISPFYLENHDFEKGTENWRICPRANAVQGSNHGTNIDTNPRPTYPIIAIEENLSVIPPGFVGFESKYCLSVGFPESVSYGSNNAWRAVSQMVTGPSTGTYVLTANRRMVSASYTVAYHSLIFLQTTTRGRDRRYFISAGISDWDLPTIDFTPDVATRTVEAALGMWASVAGGATNRERRCNWDWAILELKYPLVTALGNEDFSGFHSVATYTSAVFDTGINNPVFESITWSANTSAPGTSVKFQTRTAPAVGGPFSAWSSEILVNGAAITSPTDRCIQFRAILATEDTRFSPVLNEVALFYRLPMTDLRVDVPATIAAGDYFDFRVTAVTQTGATATAFVGPVFLSADSANVDFSMPNYSFTTTDGGTMLFQARNQVAEGFKIFAAHGAISSESQQLTSLPQSTAVLSLNGFPANTGAGQLFSFEIRALDRFGNLDINNNNLISLKNSDNFPAAIANSVQAINGVAQMTDCAFFSAGLQQFEAQDTVSGAKIDSTCTVAPGSADRLLLSASPDQYVALPFNLDVKAADQYGNPVSGLDTTFSLSAAPGGTVSPNTGTLTNGQGTLAIELSPAGNLTLSAITPGMLAGDLGLSLYPQPPPELRRFYIDAGYQQIAGVPFTLLIEARDDFENILTTYQGACRIMISAGSREPAVTTGYSFLDGILAIPITLSTAGEDLLLRVEDVKDNSKIGLMYLTVRPSGLDRFIVEAPPSATAGASFSFQVKALDKRSNILSQYTGTINLTHNAGGGDISLPSVYTFQPADAGVRLFSGTQAGRFSRAEIIRIQVEDSGRFGTSDFIEILPDFSEPQLTLQPDRNSVDLGQALSFNVALTDKFQNPLNNFAGSIDISYSEPTVNGPAVYNFQPFEDGKKRFLNEVVPTELGEFSISVTEPVSGESITTDQIFVVSGKTQNFSFSPAARTVVAGQQFSFSITASDTQGNLNQQYNDAIRFSTLDSSAYLPPESTLVNGQGSFNATFFSAGTFELVARDIKSPDITGLMTVEVTASNAAVLNIDIGLPGMSVQAGTAFPYRVYITDNFSNPVNYSGDIGLSSSDLRADSTAPFVQPMVNQSEFSDIWTFTTAGAQRISLFSADFPAVISPPIEVLALGAFRITGIFPASSSSELYTPFVVRVVDQYDNPTPLFTSRIDVTSPHGGFSPAEADYTFSARDKGEHTFYMRWDLGTAAPTNTTVTFNRFPAISIPPAGAPLTRNVFIDNPRNTNPALVQYPFMTSSLSYPDRAVIASQPFQMVFRAFSIRETDTPITDTIDFTMSDGQVFVSRDGVNYGTSIDLSAENFAPFWAVVTRTGYLSMLARPRGDPTKTGTISFYAQPGPIDRITLTAESPQQAGEAFAWLVEWWDFWGNYATNTVVPIIFSGAAQGAALIDPADILSSGRPGLFTQSDNRSWINSDFLTASATENIRRNLLLQQISIQGIYDEDFTQGALRYSGWQTENFGAPGASNGNFSLNENLLRIWTTGPGTLSTHWSNNNTGNQPANWRETRDDGYFYLYFDWPALDIYPFDARIYVKRIFYGTTQLFNPSLIGILMRDDSHNRRPRYVSTMMRNTDNAHGANDFNMLFLAQTTYRNVTNDITYRRKVSNDASTGTTHPKVLRLQRQAGGVFRPEISPDGVNWLFFGASNPVNPDPNPAFDTSTMKLGICVSSGHATFPGMAWVSAFSINRYPALASYTSVVYDTGSSTVTFTNPLRIEAERNGGDLFLYARAGNDSANIGSIAWKQLPLTWSGNQATADPSEFDGNRYLQYSLVLAADEIGNNGGTRFYGATPVIDRVTIDYNISSQGAVFANRNVDPPATLYASHTAAINNQCSVVVQGGDVDSFEIDVPASVVAGIPFTVAVRALDSLGNIADNFDGTWSFSSSDATPFPGTVPGDYTLVPAVDKGEKTFFNACVLFNGPTQTITVTDGTLTQISAVITVTPGRLGRFAVTAASPQIAGIFFPLILEAIDIYDNTKTDYSGNISFSDNKTGGVAEYSPTSLDASEWGAGLATHAPGANFSKAESINITAQGSNRAGISNQIEITNASTTSLLLRSSTPQPSSGLPFSLTVTALDQYGNQAADYTGIVHFTANDAHPLVNLPADLTFTLADQGKIILDAAATLIRPGITLMTISDVINATLTYQLSLDVLPGPATKFELSCNSIQTAGVAFNLLIKVFDDYGNLKTNFSETISLLSSFDSVLPISAGGFSNGSLLIPSVELDESALPATEKLTASFASISGDKDITLLAPATVFSRFDLETFPETPTVGDAFQLVIKAVGANGAVYKTYAGTGVSLTASNSLGLPVDPPMFPDQASGFSDGVKKLYARNWEAGEITIWAHDKTTANASGSLKVNFLPTNLSHFKIIPGTSTVELHENHYYQMVNGDFPLFFTAYDTIGNIKTDYTGTITLSHNGSGNLSVLSVDFVDGLATVAAQIYDQPGKMRITGRDLILDRMGISGNLYFFGPLNHFEIAHGYHQTDETPFLTQFTAIDDFGQEKFNFSDDLNTLKQTWDLGPLTTVSLTPATLVLNWDLGKSQAWLTVDRPNGGDEIGTFTFSAAAASDPGKTGNSTANIHKNSALGAEKLLIEVFSPQKAGMPFPIAIKAVDINNAVVKTWSEDTAVSLIDTFGNPGIINMATLLAADFVEGVYATTTALIPGAATYTINAVASTISGSFSPLVIKPGPIRELGINVPAYAPLSAPFTMSVSGISDSGQIKTDYMPEGPIMLKLNATSTGYLGVQFIEPEDFVGGVANITNQRYNKSQTIWITAGEVVENLKVTGGPIQVFGPPVRLLLQPQPSLSANFYWNAWFQILVSIRDINGYPVANFNGNIDFSVLPGTAPTAGDAAFPVGFATQFFDADSLGSKLFFLKVDYSTLDSPINLVLRAENSLYAISDITADLKFLKESVFDSFEIISPLTGSAVLKNRPFSFRIRALDNFGMPMSLTASFPSFTAEPINPTDLTAFNASPPSPLEFLNTSEIDLVGKVYFAEKIPAEVRFTVTPEEGGPAGDMVEFRVTEGFNLSNSIYQKLATETFNVPGRYLLSAFVSPGTGSAELKFTLIDNSGDPVDSYGVRIASSGEALPIGPVVNYGISLTSSDAVSPDHKVWYRVFAVFDYGFDFNVASETVIHLQNSSPNSYTASASVLFDGVQLEKALFPDQLWPTAYNPTGNKIISPSLKPTLTGDSIYQEW